MQTIIKKKIVGFRDSCKSKGKCITNPQALSCSLSFFITVSKCVFIPSHLQNQMQNKRKHDERMCQVQGLTQPRGASSRFLFEYVYTFLTLFVCIFAHDVHYILSFLYNPQESNLFTLAVGSQVPFYFHFWLYYQHVCRSQTETWVYLSTSYILILK